MLTDIITFIAEKSDIATFFWGLVQLFFYLMLLTVPIRQKKIKEALILRQRFYMQELEKQLHDITTELTALEESIKADKEIIDKEEKNEQNTKE